MILITGTGRSGTTVFTQALAKAGVDVGPYSAFAEHLEAIAINRIIMSARGHLAWERVGEMVQLIGHGIAKVPNPALKQTGLCHTLDVWWATRKDIQVIVCHRRLDNAKRSFVHQSSPMRQDLAATAWPPCTNEVATDAWMAFSFGQLMDILYTNAIPHQFFRFPEDLANPGAAWDRMAPVLKSVIGRDSFIGGMNAVVDPSLVHFT
jgi:hypothetical protein